MFCIEWKIFIWDEKPAVKIYFGAFGIEIFNGFNLI